MGSLQVRSVYMTQHEGDEYLSPEEASSMLGVSRRTIERYVKEGRIQRYRRGVRVLFKRSDVERLRQQLDEPRPD